MKKVLFILGLAFLSFTGNAQILSFDTSVDTNTILIGQQIKLTLQAEVNKDNTFQWPVFSDTIKGLELVSAGTIDTVLNGGKWKLKQELILTSFDSGYAVVPPMMLQVNSQQALSTAIAISITNPKVEADKDILDIKKPMAAPTDWLRIIVWVAGILLVLALIALVIYKLKNRKKEPSVEIDLGLSPYEYAQQQLAEIEKRQLWQAGRIKEYYTELTDVVRLYLENQMKLKAMESTADEVLEQILSLGLSKDLNAKFSQLLHTSAMVKFAKEKPSVAMNERAMESVKEFLSATKPVESKLEKNQNTTNPKV